MAPESQVSGRTGLTTDPSLACALRGPEVGARVDAWAALVAGASVVRLQSPDGVHLWFRRTGGMEEELRRLTDLEEACCPFLVFTVDVVRDQLVLSVSGLARGHA